MPKRKKKAKSVKRTTRGGVTQSVVINIGDKQKRRARSYLKPNRIQGHNLMIPQLISTRQDPFDLATVGKLQQRQTDQDNLMVRRFEEFRVNQQQQADDLEDAKQVARGLFATRQDIPIISEIPKTIDPPLQRTLSAEEPLSSEEPSFVSKTPPQGNVASSEQPSPRTKIISEQQAMVQEEAMTRQGMEQKIIEGFSNIGSPTNTVHLGVEPTAEELQQPITTPTKQDVDVIEIKKKIRSLNSQKSMRSKAEETARKEGKLAKASSLAKEINVIEAERQRLNTLLGKKSYPRKTLTPDDEGFVSQAAEEDD